MTKNSTISPPVEFDKEPKLITRIDLVMLLVGSIYWYISGLEYSKFDSRYGYAYEDQQFSLGMDLLGILVSLAFAFYFFGIFTGILLSNYQVRKNWRKK